MKKRLLVLLVIISISNLIYAEEQKIILTNNSIGEMQIKPKSIISLHQLNQSFPHYNVTHKIGSGDSPDYHIYTVSTYEKEKLFSFISYINSKN